MPNPEQLKFLLERAKKESDASACQLAQARAVLAKAEAKQALLSRYREDYHAELGSTISQGMDSERLRNFQRFIGNVAQAVEQQQHEVERSKSAALRAESVWREAQRQLQSYRALAEREAARARAADERRQQKQNDEFSTQSFLRLASKT